MQFRLFAAALLVPLFTAGCVTLTDTERAFAGQRHAEAVRLAEAEYGDITKLKTSILYGMCDSYAKLKRYNKLFPCLDQLDRNIAQGDDNIADREASERQAPGLMAFGKAISGLVKAMGGMSYEEIFIQKAQGSAALLRANAYMDFARYDEAISEAAKAIRFAENDKQERVGVESEALTLMVLANVFSGRREEALVQLARLEKSKIMWEILYAELAKCHVALGNYAKALEYMKKDPEPPLLGAFARAAAGGIMRSVSGGEDMMIFIKLPRAFMLSKALLETGDLEGAKRSYEELLGIPQLKDNGDLYWQVLYDRGRLAEKQGDAKAAIGYFRQSVEVIELQRSTINTESSKIGFVGDKQAVYRQLVAALHADRQYAAAFEYVERSKSRALVDMLAAKHDFAVTSGDPQKVRELLAMAGNVEADARVQDATADKSRTRSLVVSARDQLSAASPELSSLINVTTLTAPEIQALIPPDEALVEYYYSESDLIAFVLNSKGLSALRLENRGLAENVREFRKLLDDPKSADYLPLSKRLYDQLLRPLSGQIASAKLILVAHGPLHYLPFNALHDGQAHVIERYSLRMLPSASVMKYLRDRPVSKPGGILALGNPDLGDPRFDLANAQAEAIAIVQSQPQSRVLLRKDASETAFRQLGDGFRYLHFATHGEFNAEAPLKSALRLAKDELSDGLLSADKLYSMNLDVDLVTLSACETGLGRISNGDDVVGLTRGFLYAGSRSIVASLWQVDDLATSYLMTRFYDNLKRADKRDALRQAQRDTANKYPHPYYWAAFQITGRAE